MTLTLIELMPFDETMMILIEIVVLYVLFFPVTPLLCLDNNNA